jgi:hypothetical protein
MAYHCLFEQSGTFKNEFKKLGFDAYDYDILNDFNETDYLIDLFKEIEKEYVGGEETIFTKMDKNTDTLIAFFPCVRFEDQILLSFRGEAFNKRNWNDIQKLEDNLKLHRELNELYSLITKLAIICIRKELPLIIENPYTTQHYLFRYWCIKPKVIIKDRTIDGDYFKKPTQFWFINREPSNNFIMEAQPIVEKKVISKINGFSKESKVERSLISKEFASRFIREFILK